ncbi:hemicentin-1-like isoform X2 [Mercenaria mercenaria]|uniref:hemicentin-1-like isoform X2 n=1 Tax=Mercenaria mercenaria TaxID=6596 RepID=UPI00234E90FA|nr:hemicentin-1-like isoform X2 [Mercenaria mercenaria]
MLHFMIAILVMSTQHLTAQIVFDDTPENKAIVFGQDLFLACSARNLTTNSREGLIIQWKLNDLEVDPKCSVFPNGTLFVPSVNTDDLGNYTCVVLDSSDDTVLVSPSATVFHAYIKMFEVSPTPVNVLEDEVVSFDCITGQSAPAPEIYWERDGEVFTGGEQYSATYGGYSKQSLIIQYSMKLILRAKPHLDGAYNCVARNPVLKIDVRSRRVLMQTAEVESVPYVIDELVNANVTAALSQPLLLDCPITGKPQVDVAWYKGNTPVSEIADFFVLMNGSLHRPFTQLSDEGQYVCEGTNPLGIARTPSISVTIARIDIDFVQQPEDLYVIAGLQATLKCSPPFSVPTASVTWYKDNALFVPRTGEHAVQVVTTVEGFWNIRFKNIQKIDEGEYFCVATNTYAVPSSRTSVSATVSVGGAPIFVEPPVGLTIEKGKLAQLTCYVQGDPFPEITWLFENEVLTVSETISFRQGNQELWIGNINKGNEGTYTCRAVNRYSTIQTRVYVKVLVPPVVLESVGHTVASKGDAVLIPCGIYSDPDPKITWYKDSAAITMGDRFTQLHNGLYITSVRVEDSGTYLCHASNMAGDTENEGTLEVLVRPYFLEKPEDQVVNIGRNLTLTCIANGFPKPEITWLFNGSSLFPRNTLLSLNGEQLLLLEVSWMHVGTYSCTASNEEGMKRAEATVTVRVSPKVQKIEGVPLLYLGENIQLKCRVTGIPSPSIEWFFNRQLIVPSKDGRISIPEPTVLIVKFVTLSDEGVYSCKGINAAGVSQRDIDIYIITRPSPPVLQKAETVSATSVMLSWSIEQRQPQTPVDRVYISYRKWIDTSRPYLKTEVESDTAKYLVEDLDPASRYVFMVSAVNDAGTSDISNILSAQTYDAGPSAPRNLQVMDIKAYNITIGWEIPLTTNGRIKKYQINLRKKNELQDRTIIVSSDNDANHDYIIRDLTPYTWYTLEVRGATMEGDQVLWGNWSNIAETRTSQTAPTGRPNAVKAKALTPYVVQVSWEAVAQQEQNGPIKRYYVRYWLLHNVSTPLGEEVIDSLDLQVNISDLHPWTWYMVKVVAENAGGLGEASEGATVRTLPTAPARAPLNLTAEVQSDSAILVKWQPPPAADWNSELSGFIVQYWQHSDYNISQVRSLGVLNLTTVISDLDPYTTYGVCVAAFTDQVTNGVGPYTDNITVQTEQSYPGPVADLSYTASSTTLMLSWKPPEVTNGVITNYLVLYHSVGTAVVTTPFSLSKPTLGEHISELLNNLNLLKNIFDNFEETLTEGLIQPLANICDIILHNKTLYKEVQNETDILQSDELTQIMNISSNAIFDWMNIEHISVGKLCLNLQDVLTNILNTDIEENVAADMLNVTTSKTAATLSDLQSGHIYNISVLAATAAGYGQHVTMEAVTSPAIPNTTQRPVVPVTRRPVTDGPPLLQTGDDSEPLNLPVIIGGGVSGFVLFLIVLLIGGCLCMKRRTQSDEKSKVIREEALEDTNANNMYGQLDRPSTRPAVAKAAEDGTDSVDIYGDEVRFHSPQHQYDQSTDRSFMTEESGDMMSSHGRRIKEAFLGLENPSYSGLAAPTTMKSNPAYYEEPSSSDLESMSVTMAFSSEDTLYAQAGESTLKRKSKMKSSDAAAIARLKNRSLPPGLSDTDKSSLINNEVEVIYNERTAL